MPDISAMALSGTIVSAPLIYSEGLFAPTATGTTSLEILDGGMDVSNYVGTTNTIPGWAVQPGAMCHAQYKGFDNWEMAYACTMGMDAVGSPKGKVESVFRQIHGGASTTYFLPWNASVILYFVQLFCRQDATEWDSDADSAGGRRIEYWDYRIRLDGAQSDAMYGRLPQGRTTIGGPTGGGFADPDGDVDPGDMVENRWRFVSKIGMIITGTSLNKGRHFIRLSTWAAIFTPDPSKAKLVVPTGGIGVLAFR